MPNLGAPEIILIILVLVLLFGAKKLPELARGSGRALRIFKAETKGLMDDDDDKLKTPEQRQIDAQRVESQRVESERVDPIRPDEPIRRPQEQPGSDTDR
jgi:sec-independent protein translocase protein TatA